MSPPGPPAAGAPSDLAAWEAWSPEEATCALRDVRAPWHVAGGWALDLFLGRVTRAHGDLEVGVRGDRFPEVAAALDRAGLDLSVVGGDHAWPLGDPRADPASPRTTRRGPGIAPPDAGGSTSSASRPTAATGSAAAIPASGCRGTASSSAPPAESPTAGRRRSSSSRRRPPGRRTRPTSPPSCRASTRRPVAGSPPPSPSFNPATRGWRR